MTPAPEKLPILNALSTFSDSTFSRTFAVLPVDPQQRLSEQHRTHCIRNFRLFYVHLFKRLLCGRIIAPQLSARRHPLRPLRRDTYRPSPENATFHKETIHPSPLSEPRPHFALTVAVKGSLVLPSFPPSSDKRAKSARLFVEKHYRFWAIAPV